MKLTTIAKKADDLNLSFILSSFGICVILLWIGSFKFYAVEANGVAVMVRNSPLISWEYKLFGVLPGAGILGITEIVAASGIILGNFFPKLGIIGSMIAILIFFITSTFILTTPGVVHKVVGVWRLSDLGSFLFKGVTLLGASLNLLTHFGREAIKKENRHKPIEQKR